MRIEGIGDGGTGLSNRAFEQARAYRLAIRPAANPAAATAATQPEQSTKGFVVQDVHDSPPPSDERTEVVTSAAEVMQAATAPQKVLPPVEPKKMDSDGDGWIDVNDLPYDYFQIVRRTNIKLRTEPMEQPHSVGATAAAAPAAGATATTTAPATGRVSASMVASIDAI